MGFEERWDFLVGPWDECPGLFLPEKVLDLCFRVLPTPSKEIMTSIAFLAWDEDEALAYFGSMHKKRQAQKEDDMKREKWKQHPLYKENKETLIKTCNRSGLFPTGKKDKLVQQIVQNQPSDNDKAPCPLEAKLYDGKMESIPTSSAGLMRLSVAQLRAILRTHRVLDVGTKEELISRVGLLKAGYPEAAFSRERLCILHIIEAAKLITRTLTRFLLVRFPYSCPGDNLGSTF